MPLKTLNPATSVIFATESQAYKVNQALRCACLNTKTNTASQMQCIRT